MIDICSYCGAKDSELIEQHIDDLAHFGIQCKTCGLILAIPCPYYAMNEQQRAPIEHRLRRIWALTDSPL